MPRTPRPIRIEGDVAYVSLTKGYEAVIDAADVSMVDGFCWCACENRATVYAVRSHRDDFGRISHVKMHRALMRAPQVLLVDHRDGNGLNNRRSTNLRLATKSQNQWNSAVNARNKIGCKGVSFAKREGKWRAVIGVGGKLCSLGYFHSPEEAASAYRAASSTLHGEFGRLA